MDRMERIEEIGMERSVEELNVSQAANVDGRVLYRFIKRSFDFAASLLGLLFLALPMLLIGLCVKCSSPGPVLFRQQKFGRNDKIFVMYKFRSMRTEAPHDAPTCMLECPQAYITKVGAILRKTSLDELPQLFNILKGDMSIIGPRPGLVKNEEVLIEARHSNGSNRIRPGLTGWAQVNGRDAISMEQKADYDGWYYRNASFGLDVKIFLMTVAKVLRGSDVVEGGPAALEPTRSEDQVFAEMPAVAAEAAAADRAVTANAEVAADRGVKEMPTGVMARAAAVDVPLAEEVVAEAASADETLFEEPMDAQAVLIDVREEPVLEPCAEAAPLTDEEVFGTAPAGTAEAPRPEHEVAETVKIA